jgi:uncharacterized protein (DUF1697 family)
MRNLIITEYVRVDGITEGFEQWFFPFWDDDIGKVKHDELNERYALINKVFYLHAPDGIGRSKLAAKDWGWSVVITARNWRTVSTLLSMALAA